MRYTYTTNSTGRTTYGLKGASYSARQPMFAYTPHQLSGIAEFGQYFRHIRTEFDRLTSDGTWAEAYPPMKEEFVKRKDGGGCRGLGISLSLYNGSTVIYMERDGRITHEIEFVQPVYGCADTVCMGVLRRHPIEPVIIRFSKGGHQ